MEQNPPEGEAPSLAGVLADETREGADSYARFAERRTRYAKARHRALEMMQYIAAIGASDNGKAKVYRELASCGDYLVFRHFLQSDVVRLHGMRSCRQHLICPLCAIRRGARMLARYLERVDLVVDENPNLKLYVVGLTVKNGLDLAERYAHLHAAQSALNKTRHRNAGRGMLSEFCKASGAVYSYEVTRNQADSTWHPHIHAIWLCEESPDPVALSADWKRITGDSYIVDVHALYGERVDAFCEVFKYAVKFTGLPVSDNWEAFGALRRHQLIGSVGNLRGVAIPADLTDELLDEEKWVDMLYRFIDQGGPYWGYELQNVWNSPADASYPAYEPMAASTKEFIRDASASRR